MPQIKRALVFNIMRYSIHDGPGIRTTIFFKGCPLSCKWCHNPENFDRIADGNSASGNSAAYEISAPDLLKEIKKDLPFYEQSQGGVTFSGGEPFHQGEFLLDILSMCREEYINTAVDTSGFSDSEILLKAAEMANYILYDIKFLDSKKHEEYCGAPNDLILKNLKLLGKSKTKLLIRIPVIPSINDDAEEMAGIYSLIKDIKNIDSVHLLPYHKMQIDKYKRLGLKYELAGIPEGKSPKIAEIKKLFETGFRTKIGG